MAPSLKKGTSLRLGPRLKQAATKKAELQEKTLSEYIRDLIEKDLREGK